MNDDIVWNCVLLNMCVESEFIVGTGIISNKLLITFSKSPSAVM